MLIGAFQVEIRRVTEALPLTGDGGPARTRVKPDIHRVGALAPLCGVALVAWREELCFILLPPDIRSVGGDQITDVCDRIGVQKHITAGAVIEDRDRHTPGALSRDAPVAPLGHHRFDPVAAGGRQPVHRIDGAEGLIPESFNGGEPLFGCPENRWLFGSPVVGVTVFVALLLQQCP